MDLDFAAIIWKIMWKEQEGVILCIFNERKMGAEWHYIILTITLIA